MRVRPSRRRGAALLALVVALGLAACLPQPTGPGSPTAPPTDPPPSSTGTTPEETDDDPTHTDSPIGILYVEGTTIYVWAAGQEQQWRLVIYEINQDADALADAPPAEGRHFTALELLVGLDDGPGGRVDQVIDMIARGSDGVQYPMDATEAVAISNDFRTMGVFVEDSAYPSTVLFDMPVGVTIVTVEIIENGGDNWIVG